MGISDKLNFDVRKWEGKNFFHFNLFCLSGPSNLKPFIMTSTFGAIPYFAHLYSTATWFTDNLSVAVPIIGGVLLLFSLYFMGLTTFIDPGIIPRNKPPSYFSESTKRKKRPIVHLGFIKKVNKCDTCFIIKPYRSSHCPDCNNCVLRFDHHCPWVGNCVAQRNYKYFYSFLVCLNIFCAYLIAFSIYHIVKTTETKLEILDKTASQVEINKTSKAMSYSICSLFVIMYCFIKMLFITGLLGYHTFLVNNNITTKEELKNTFKDTPQGNPYTRECTKNWSLLFCCQRKWKLSLFDMMKEQYESKTN